MQFRERGRTIQLLRQSSEKKPEVVGRLNKLKLVLDDDVKARLTPAEIAVVEAFIENEEGKKGRASAAYADQFPEILKAVTLWLESADTIAAETFIRKIRPPLTKLRRTIKEKRVVPRDPGRREQGVPSV